MKTKFFVPIILSVIIGLAFGKVFFDNYNNNSVTVFNEKEKVYLLRITFENEKEMKKSFKNYESFLYKEKDGKYNLYVGLTKSKKNASLIKEFFERKKYNVYAEEKIIDNKKFMAILNEYDRIFDITDSEDIENIEKIVIANYKEMVLENET